MSTTVLAAGDVFPDLPNGRELLSPLRPLLHSGDVVFGNCEGVYSDRPEPSPTHKHYGVAPRSHGDFLGDAGFTVMGLANNHAVDGGHRGLADTIALLDRQGVAVTGAGATLEEATRPLVVTHGDTTIAFVSYCSVFPRGAEAREGRPGIAGLRVLTSYHEPDPNFWEPGIDPMVTTAAHPDDLARLERSLAVARDSADVVIASFHWGYSSTVRDLQPYELELAAHAARHGADAVICHHHHALRGIRVVEGVPVFHGLGTLLHHLQVGEQTRRRNTRRHGELASMSDADEAPHFPYRDEARTAGVVVLEIDGGAVTAAGLVLTRNLSDGSAVALHPDDPLTAGAFDYLDVLNHHVGFDTRLTRGTWREWACAGVLFERKTS